MKPDGSSLRERERERGSEEGEEGETHGSWVSEASEMVSRE